MTQILALAAMASLGACGVATYDAVVDGVTPGDGAASAFVAFVAFAIVVCVVVAIRG